MQRIVKFKWSLIREGIEINAIYDDVCNSFWIGTDFKKEGDQISLFPGFPWQERIFIPDLHESQSYIVLPDYQCDIFVDLKIIGSLHPSIDNWNLDALNRVRDLVNEYKELIYK